MEVQWSGQAGGERNERVEEARKIRRLQMMISMVM
jgi:quercetin dioxygenase-like cupin family protein